jgi:predicted adenylyl cyclase CyaB
MREIEAKILEIDMKDLEKRLKKLGATKREEYTMEMTFFDTKSGFMKRHRNAVRIRNEGKKNVMTFKEFIPNKKLKVRNEYNLEISDLDVARKILELLGFHVSLKLKKRKIAYAKGRTRFEFNIYLGEYAHVPPFLEIEVPNQKTLFEYVRKLGIPESSVKPWSTFDVIRHYRKE